MATDHLARQATCEDYDSDESNGPVLESFRRSSPSSNANANANANATAKRSQPSDLGAEKAPTQQQQSQSQQQSQQQPRVPVNIDLQSDSGYSSHTAATMSSADSAPSFSSSTRSPPMPIPPAVAAPFPSQSPAQTQRPRRPTIGEPRPSNSQNAPRPKPPGRRESQSSKQRPAIVQRRPTITQEPRPRPKPSRDDDDECRDPNCTGCGPNALVQRRRPEPPPASDSALDVSYTYNPRQRSDAPTSSYASPPSPTYPRPPQYAQGAAIAQPGQTRRRSSAAHQRPVTYHGDGPTYWMPGMPAPYPSPPQEHGPPPSMSAYRNMPQYPNMPSYMPPSSQPSNGFYTPAQSIHQTSPPYEVQRPTLSARSSSSYSRNNYPPPVVTQERGERMYSARFGQPASATQPMFPPAPFPLGEEDSESESDSEHEYTPDPREARALMAPPKITGSSKRRPSIRKAKTTQVVDRVDRPERLERPERPDRRMSQSMTNMPERPAPKDREPERYSRTTRGASISRPALVQQRQTQSAYETQQARVIVEAPKASRRQSYHGHDIVQVQDMQYIPEQKRSSKVFREERHDSVEHNEQKRRNRSSKIYQDDRYEPEEDRTEQKRKNRSSRVIHQERYASDSNEDEQGQELAVVPLSNRRRRDTDAEPRRGKERTMEPKNKSLEAEEYISATRGSRDLIVDQIHKAAKRASRAPSGRLSESGSSDSKGSSKDSQSNRTAITSSGANDVIRLRVDASAPLSLSFNGDMEGRTLQFTPAENGMADIVIGGARGNESTYRSERDSVTSSSSRKLLMANQARREAEDASQHSSRSGRSRREGRESREIREEWEEPRRILGRRRDTHYH